MLNIIPVGYKIHSSYLTSLLAAEGEARGESAPISGTSSSRLGSRLLGSKLGSGVSYLFTDDMLLVLSPRLCSKVLRKKQCEKSSEGNKYSKSLGGRRTGPRTGHSKLWFEYHGEDLFPLTSNHTHIAANSIHFKSHNILFQVWYGTPR